MITDLYNAVSTPVAATRDALSECLQSVRDTASLLYSRIMHHISETLKSIVGNAAKEEESQRVGCGLLPDWPRKKRCTNALDTFYDNLCVWRCLAIYTRRDIKRGSEFVTKEALNLAREFYSDNKLKRKDVRATKLVDFEGIAKHLNNNIRLYEGREWQGCR